MKRYVLLSLMLSGCISPADVGQARQDASTMAYLDAANDALDVALACQGMSPECQAQRRASLLISAKLLDHACKLDKPMACALQRKAEAGVKL